VTARNKLAREAATYLVGGVLVSATACHYTAFEHFAEWSQVHEVWRAEEIITVLFVVAVLVTIFAVRRLVDATREAGDRERAEKNLRGSERRFVKAFEASPYPMLVMDTKSQVILEANQELVALTGHSHAAMIGKRLEELGIRMERDVRRAVQGMLDSHRRLRNVDLDFQTSDGKQHSTLCSVEEIDFNGTDAVLVALNDITERKELEALLSHQAFHDSLTGLANRSLFRDRLDHALARSVRHDWKPVVLYLDLDEFKRVNDTLGHAVGDQVLKEAATRITTCLRSADTCARLGGDEFAILLDEGTQDDAVAIAERLVASMRTPFVLADGIVYVGVSVGIATSAPETSADDLLRNADVAMYMSKTLGKGQLTVFEPTMHAEVVERLRLGADINGALERGEFVVHYQPISTIPTGAIIGIEALVRWNHPELGQLLPERFIPIAEETGIIVPIGEWVLRQACQQCRLLNDRSEQIDPLTVSVNLSGRQLVLPDIVRVVETALAETGLPATLLILEITESVLVHNDADTVERLWSLKRIGVQLAIDDFGTGYSSLAYLQRFPVDILKIDKSFTDRLGTGNDESPLSRAVVSLGHTLNVRTIAEGIETPEQWARLNNLGCELGQGYLIARPMTADGLEIFLVANEAEHGAAAHRDHLANNSSV
jgi:diguanylate cyclase (GGDEF)-like protein/PAS domain S-box-containing protein